MRIEGDNWESWIYPALQWPVSRLLRRIVPRRVLAATLAQLVSAMSRKAAYPQTVASAASSLLPRDTLAAFMRAHIRFVVSFYLEMADLTDQPRRRIKQHYAP